MGLFFKDYESAGPGISKSATRKKGIALFFDIFFRKFWRLIGLNVLFSMSCLPFFGALAAISFMKNYDALLVVLGVLLLAFTIIIGPATAGMTKVLRCFILEKHTYIIRDFFRGFRDNFKKSLVVGIIDVVVAASVIASYNVYPGMVAAYRDKMSYSEIFYVPMIITFSLSIVVAMMNFYIYPMIIGTDLTMKKLLKNSFALAFVGMKSNIVPFVAEIIAVVGMVLLFLFNPPVCVTLMPFIPASIVWFIIVFNCYPVIQKYVINPHYDELGQVNPELIPPGEEFPEEEPLFEDMGGKEKPVEKPAEKPVEKRKKSKGKRIS